MHGVLISLSFWELFRLGFYHWILGHILGNCPSSNVRIEIRVEGTMSCWTKPGSTKGIEEGCDLGLSSGVTGVRSRTHLQVQCKMCHLFTLAGGDSDGGSGKKRKACQTIITTRLVCHPALILDPVEHRTFLTPNNILCLHCLSMNVPFPLPPTFYFLQSKTQSPRSLTNGTRPPCPKSWIHHRCPPKPRMLHPES